MNTNPTSLAVVQGGLQIEDIKQDFKKHLETFKPVAHQQIFKQLLAEITPVDFEAVPSLKDRRITLKHLRVYCVYHVLRLAKAKNWGLCLYQGAIYLYNGAFWKQVEEKSLQTFLGRAAERMGIDKYHARDYRFREQLLNQFLSYAHLPSPPKMKGVVLINLLNGTFEICPQYQRLRPPRRRDFQTYQLPFAYDERAQAPLFQQFLNRVLPDTSLQQILAEYLGYVFIHNDTLKLEKTLLLYGTGANGKSVFFEVVNALLGKENVSNYSLHNLTNDTGYYRAKLANKLVNYASEVKGDLEAAVFKQLSSGEPVEARLPYGEPHILEGYAKLIFNCNELPKEVEHTHAFFRRFLIVPFLVTIPEEEQDKALAHKIIESELSGVFNWVLDGLRRLLDQKSFTHSNAAKDQVEEFKKQSDNVLMFLEDERYVPSRDEKVKVKLSELYAAYRQYCQESGFRCCHRHNFGKRLRAFGLETKRTNDGVVVFAEKRFF